MNCLSGLVGLRGCSQGTPGSGLYVNSLPGIPMDMLDKIANSDQDTISGLWSDTQIVAQEQLLTDFTILMSDKVQLNSIARSFQLPTAISGNAPSGAFDNGFTLDFGYDHPVSRLMKVGVDKIGFYMNAVAAGEFDIKIVDYDTSEELWSLTVNTVADPLTQGWNYFDVLESFWCKHLKFYYVANSQASKQILLNESLNYQFSSCYCTCSCNDCPGRIRGISNGTFSDNYSYGLTAAISFECSFESVICNNRKKFSRPYWYLLGHTIMAQTLSTNRFNRYTTTDRKIIAGLRDDYFKDYSDAMKVITNGITMNDDDYCLTCDAPITRGYYNF